MSRPLFTPEELEELRRADEEIDAEFCETIDEIVSAKDRCLSEEQKKKRLKNREHYQKNRDKLKLYREQNKETAAAYRKKYYEEHKEEIRARARAYQKAYYRKNRDAIREKQREYDAQNRDIINVKKRERYKKEKEEAKCTSMQSTSLSGK